MSAARKRLRAWLRADAGRRALELGGAAALKAAFMAGWVAAVRRERRAQRFSLQLLIGRIKALQLEIDARRLAAAMGRSFALHQAVEGETTPPNLFDALDEIRAELQSDEGEEQCQNR